MENRHVVSFILYDPGQDAIVPILRVPDDHVYTVEAAYATVDRTTAAATAYFTEQLYNADTPGTAVVTAVTDAVGGSLGWVANTAKTMTVVDGAGDLTAGQWLVVKHDETNAVTPGVISITVEYVDGIGSKAAA